MIPSSMVVTTWNNHWKTKRKTTSSAQILAATRLRQVRLLVVLAMVSPNLTQCSPSTLVVKKHFGANNTKTRVTEAYELLAFTTTMAGSSEDSMLIWSGLVNWALITIWALV